MSAFPFPSTCHDATPWSPDFSSTFLGATLDATRFLFHVSRCHPLTSPNFSSTRLGATPWRHWVQFQHTQALKCYKFTCSNYVSFLSSCAFVVRASCAEFWFQFVVVIGSCHLLFFCCRFLLSFVVCGCDSHFLLFTTFQVVNIVCFCVHLCAYVCCRRIPITLVFSIHATIFAIISIVVLYVGMVCGCVFLCCSCFFKVRIFLST